MTVAVNLAGKKPGFEAFVIVHEVLHLLVPKHGLVFRALMTAYAAGGRRHDATRRFSAGTKSRTT